MEPQWIIRRLNSRLSDRSRAQYVSALEYVAAWYRLRHDGELFPWAREPACPIYESAIAAFVEDQLPIILDGRVVPSMDPEVYQNLHELGYFRGHSCPSEATTRWRLKVISARQVRNGSYVAEKAFSEGQVRVRTEWQRVNAALGSRQLAVSSGDFVRRLRGACPDTRDGIRNRALVTLMQVLTTSQLAQLQLGDLNAGQALDGDVVVPVVDITICCPANQFQQHYPQRRLFGADAEAVASWLTYRVQDDVGMRADAPSTALPFLLRETASGGTADMSREWVLLTFHRLATIAGLEAAGQACRPSMLRSVGDCESAEYRRLVMIADQLGLERVDSAYRMVEKR